MKNEKNDTGEGQGEKEVRFGGREKEAPFLPLSL
tara:strand:+ start:220 stop:321 length:102 start_codon:yes stop_codon:yes gene_type:complete